MKILSYDNYQKLKTDISKYNKLIKEKDSAISHKVEEIATVTKERDVYKKSSPINDFCSDCKWQGKISCGSRADYIKSNNQQNGIDEIKLNMLKESPQCKK